MSTHFHIDSTWRDNTVFTNPAEFNIPVEVSNDWVVRNRTVLPVRPHHGERMPNMVHNVKLLNLTIPYDFGGSVGTSFLDSHPFVYVAFQSTTMYKDAKLINTLNNRYIENPTTSRVSLKDAVFVAYCDKLQTTGNGISWIQYKCNMTQTYRINLKDSLSFRVFTNDGITLDITDTSPAIDSTKQVNALFEVTPFVRDGEFDNHNSAIYQPGGYPSTL